jgi:hypothetical protein
MYVGVKRIGRGTAIMPDIVYPLFALLEYSPWISPKLPPYRCGTPDRPAPSSSAGAGPKQAHRTGPTWRSTSGSVLCILHDQEAVAVSSKKVTSSGMMKIKFDIYLLIGDSGSLLYKSLCIKPISCGERDIRTFLLVSLIFFGLRCCLSNG